MKTFKGFIVILSIASTSIISLCTNLFAQDAPPSGSPLGGFFPLIIIFFIFYFLLIRPQQKKSKEHQKMLSALKKDDRIVTTGGIHATIANIKGQIIEVKIAEGVKIQIDRNAIGHVLPSENQPVTPEVIK